MTELYEKIPIIGVVVAATRDANGNLIYLEAGAGGAGGGAVTQGTSPWVISSTQLATLLTLIGEVQATPTANTVLDRLKDIADLLTSLPTTTSIADGADVAQGDRDDVAWAGSGQATTIAALKAIYAKIEAARVLLAADLDVVLKNSSGTEIGTDANPVDVQQAALDVDVDDVSVAGKIAHDAVDTGAASNPIGIGYRAIAHGTNPTAVAAADRTVGYSNRAGIPFVIGGHPNIQTIEATVLDADGAQTNAALVTVSAGAKVVVTRVTVTADNANTVDVAVRIGFGAATLVAASATPVAGMVASHRGIPAGGGFNVGDGSGILAIGADGEDLRYTCEDPVTGGIVVTVSYYTIES